MRAGANGFLLKDTSAKELADAVRIIAQGNALLAPSVTKRLIEEFANRTESNPTTTKCSSQPTSLNANTNHCNCLPAA
jgi:DNA-binding NarL/FixJ family response regulator